MTKLAIIAFMRDEGHILDEWIQHHQRQGVDHFFIADNGSKDTSMEILSKYSNVTVIDGCDRPQRECYVMAYKEARTKFDWVICLDLDEFLYATEPGQTLVTQLADVKTTAVRVAWTMFLPTTIHQPKSVIAQSVLACAGDIKSRTPYKTIFRTTVPPNAIKIHGPNLNSEQVLRIPARHGKFAINHYRFQSYEYLLGVKAPRGGGVDKTKYTINRGLKLLDAYFNNAMYYDMRLRDLTHGHMVESEISPATRIYESSPWKQFVGQSFDTGLSPRQLFQQIKNYVQ